MGQLGEEEGQIAKKGEGSSRHEGGEGPSTAHTALAWMLSGACNNILTINQGFPFIHSGVKLWFVFVFAVCSVSILNNKLVRDTQMALLPTDSKSGALP